MTKYPHNIKVAPRLLEKQIAKIWDLRLVETETCYEKCFGCDGINSEDMDNVHKPRATRHFKNFRANGLRNSRI